MSSRLGDLCRELYHALTRRYPDKKKPDCQAEAYKFWNETKTQHDMHTREFVDVIQRKIDELNNEATRRKLAGSVQRFFLQAPALKRPVAPDNAIPGPSGVKFSKNGHQDYAGEKSSKNGHQEDDHGEKSARNGDQEDIYDSDGPSPSSRKGKAPRPISDDENDDDVPSVHKKSYPTPKQDTLKNQIAVIESDLNALVTKRDLLNDHSSDQEIEKLRKTLRDKTRELADTQARILRAKNSRKKKRDELKRIKEVHPEIISSALVREKIGRPRIEEDQTGLLQAICDLTMHAGSADDRRRSEMIRACKTLDQLQEGLPDMGFVLSRSATYLRLLPRNSTTLEGRHVVTVPVKLCRAQSDSHRNHEDQHFCRATIESAQQLASILGPQQAAFISQDDKAKVPIGMTAAKCQAPLLMHLQYKVRLPDHDWLPGSRHKLTPSVYAALAIKDGLPGQKEAVTYSGPTFIAIRSAKHSSSTATTHAKDFNRLLTVRDFDPFLKDVNGNVKPVVLLSVDGGPDENPRYKKVIAHAITHFIEYDLDAIFIFTNAPGRSAYNPVERRLAPLSRALSGLILPHDSFGDHLDHNGDTVDEDLEKKNFAKAGSVLADVWSEMTIDGHNVSAEFVPDDEILPVPKEVSDLWYVGHVRESQYLLQIVKCDDRSCCSPFRSNLRDVLYQRFLPPPFPIKQQEDSPKFFIPSPEKHKSEKFLPLLVRQTLTLRPEYPKTQEIPYDFYYPSIKGVIPERVCCDCGIYFASKAAVNIHRRGAHSKTDRCARVTPLKILGRRPGELLCVVTNDFPEWIDVENVDDEAPQAAGVNAPNGAPIIEDVGQWVAQGRIFEEDLAPEKEA